jgi:hypothetical protein
MTLADTVDALHTRSGDLASPRSSSLMPSSMPTTWVAEDRWPEFASAAVQQTPVRSVLSYRLAADQQRPIGSLNLYATRRHAFTPDAVRDTADVAGQATIALAYLAERQTVLRLEPPCKPTVASAPHSASSWRVTG